MLARIKSPHLCCESRSPHSDKIKKSYIDTQYWWQLAIQGDDKIALFTSIVSFHRDINILRHTRAQLDEIWQKYISSLRRMPKSQHSMQITFDSSSINIIYTRLTAKLSHDLLRSRGKQTRQKVVTHIHSARARRVHSHDETHKQQPWGPLSAKRLRFEALNVGQECVPKKNIHKTTQHGNRENSYISRAPRLKRKRARESEETQIFRIV